MTAVYLFPHICQNLKKKILYISFQYGACCLPSAKAKKVFQLPCLRLCFAAHCTYSLVFSTQHVDFTLG